MGAVYLDLDPPGFTHATEPGAHFSFTGKQLLEHWLKSITDTAIQDCRILNPPGSEWILPRPIQFDPEWDRDPVLQAIQDDYVLNLALWTFGAGMNATTWIDPTMKPGGTPNVNNEWIVIPKVPDPIPAIDLCDYDAMGDACGVALPAGFGTLGFVFDTPVGGYLNEGQYTPFLRALLYPTPDQALVFGFGDLALLLYETTYYLVKTPLNDKRTWELLARGDMKATRQAWSARMPSWAGTQQSMTSSAVRVEVASVLVLPVGLDQLYLYFNGTDPAGYKFPGAPTIPPGGNWAGIPAHFHPGTWWIGSAPGAKVVFQPQIVGYDFGTLPLTFRDSLFRLGENYKPTEEPVIEVVTSIHAGDAAGLTDVTAAGVRTITGVTSGETIELGLKDELGATWASDGTHHEGDFDLFLGASNPGVSASYLTPQLRLLNFRFPVHLEDRVNSLLRLNDTQYQVWEVENSLYDTDGKGIQITLNPEGAALAVASGHAKRAYYPFWLIEDTDGDGTPDTIRVVGWITQPHLSEAATEGTTRVVPIYGLRLDGRSLLSRGKQKWTYLPQIGTCDGSGFVEHTDAVREIVNQIGIDVADAALYQEQVDIYAGTDIARLPGWGDDPGGGVGLVTSKVIAVPDWDEEKLAFAERVANDWRGWRLFEEFGGLIRYEADPMQLAAVGNILPVVVTIHMTREAASAAGFPGCYALDELDWADVEPEGNIIRMSGAAVLGRIPHIIDRATETVTDIDNVNFLGEYRIPAKGANVEDLADNERALRQLARVRLSETKLRRRAPTVAVPLPFWDIGPNGIEVGDAFTLAGSRGDFLVQHLETRCLKRDVYRTIITGQQLQGPGY